MRILEHHHVGDILQRSLVRYGGHTYRRIARFVDQNGKLKELPPQPIWQVQTYDTAVKQYGNDWSEPYAGDGYKELETEFMKETRGTRFHRIIVTLPEPVEDGHDEGPIAAYEIAPTSHVEEYIMFHYTVAQAEDEIAGTSGHRCWSAYLRHGTDEHNLASIINDFPGTGEGYEMAVSAVQEKLGDKFYWPYTWDFRTTKAPHPSPKRA